MNTTINGNEGTALILKAALFAAGKHKNQRRKGIDAEPYINHPLALATLLANEGGVTNVNVLCAALLHDTIEDTKTTPEELQELFGDAITAIVLEVTDDKSLTKKERKQMQIEHAKHASAEAKLVKLADKICNLNDILVSPPAHWPLERIREYFDWSNLVVAGVRHVHPGLAERFDALYAQKPSATNDQQ
ncbi:MAG: HD domain-containing protein [Burkholderiales bacterium]|jgi:guanosine-3',5'-bis(diphosphate) 3'-pyrophosphohydrolase|nr:HD domain-containing protein [Burkholderiales bacterium]